MEILCYLVVTMEIYMNLYEQKLVKKLNLVLYNEFYL